ncbi:MAG: N-acetyl-gamma-glutamyl-phosphate reductase [Oscillospiraceae bacterium]|nr:N-acetyl-gamma-glutamyl-phosphate reductase [Oscillospiraceae bacterium]
MKPKIFIDGREGTTGLQIFDRLGSRQDIELLLIDEARRKDVRLRKEMINSADVVFLCLPDEAAKESVALVENNNTRIIDASTAHRTASDWVYGFPELSKERRKELRNARWVSNPGCHSTGIIAAAYPLIAAGVLPRDYLLSCISLTGYSGGGKSMIHAYEEEKRPGMYAPGMYGLNLKHKHLPEIIEVLGLSHPPVFCPIVDDYYCGIAATIMLHNKMLSGKPTAEEILAVLSRHYANERFVTVAPALGSGTLESNWGAGTNMLRITVSGNDETTIVTSQLDNLGKGASGAAVQNMNIMLGFNEEEGL